MAELARNPLMAFIGEWDKNDATNAQRQMQGIQAAGMLSKMAGEGRAQQQDLAVQDVMRKAGGNVDAAIPALTQLGTPAALKTLGVLSQIAGRAQSDKLHAAQMGKLDREAAVDTRQQGALSALAGHLTQPAMPYDAATGPKPTMYRNEAELAQAAKEHNAANPDVPFRGDVNNPNTTLALAAMSGRPGEQVIKALTPPKPTVPTMSSLGKLMAERNALPPNDPRRRDYDRVIADAKGPGGVNVTVNPNAPITLGKPAGNKIDEGLLDTTKGIMQLNTIDSMFKPEYQRLLPRAGAEWSSWKEKLGGNLNPEDKRFVAEFSAYKRNAINSMNEYIKSITGAAMSEKEAERITRGMPNPGQGLFDGDGPTEFKSKLDDAMTQTKMALARFEYIKRNGMSMDHVTLERMPKIINQRGTELENQMRAEGTPEDKISSRVRQLLAKEFGLVH